MVHRFRGGCRRLPRERDGAGLWGGRVQVEPVHCDEPGLSRLLCLLSDPGQYRQRQLPFPGDYARAGIRRHVHILSARKRALSNRPRRGLLRAESQIVNALICEMDSDGRDGGPAMSVNFLDHIKTVEDHRIPGMTTYPL